VSGHYGGDGFHSYLTAESIVLDGDVAILDRPFGIPEMARGARMSAPVGPDGRIYSQYGLGLPLVEAPLYAAGLLASRALPSIPSDYVTMGVVSTLNAFLTAAAAALLFVAARRFGARGRSSLLAPLAFALGSFAWGNSRIGYAEPLLTLCLFGAFLLVSRGASPPSRRDLLLGGLAAGLAIHAKVYAIAFVPVLFAVVWTAASRGRERVAATLHFGLPVLAALLLAALANDARFGSPFRTGYQVASGAGDGYRFDPGPRMAPRILGLLVSPGKGIAWYAPAVVLSAVLFARFRRSRPRVAAWSAVMLLAHLAFYGSFTFWHGDAAWGPRFLLPVLPFLLLPLADPATLPAASGGGRIAWLLVAAGALVEIPVLLVNFSRHIESFAARGIPYWSLADSPIPGNWKALLSAAAGRGEWDVWFLTIPAIRPSPLTAVACAGAFLGLLLLAGFLFRLLLRRLAFEEAS
jgi:hypothetical protein